MYVGFVVEGGVGGGVELAGLGFSVYNLVD